MNTLPPDRWHQIDQIFAEALDCADDERDAFVQQACAGDLDLYREVLALLDSRDAAQAALGESATGFAGPLLPGLHDHLALTDRLPTDARIGPYRILDEIGRGGMGAVYLAERDGQYRRRVALKLVKRGMDTDEVLRRFRYERKILAALEHPHIARLYDGGMSDDDRPYLAMEYIDGAPIDAYCDDKRLDVDQRLRLFETVCAAVQYAHRNLVVHRDLKPSNILVTDDGQVKLLDFGIAKLLDQEPDASAPVTRTGMRVMTPDYASPEQMRGEIITTASDVYQLGMILYELLTGQRPHETTDKESLRIDHAELDHKPVRPSTAVTKASEQRRRDGTTQTITPDTISQVRATTVEGLQRRLRGDLDTIVLMALRQEPERRYASPEAFVEDIKRHLAGLPVTAQPDTRRYRLGKFIQRHRFGTLTTAAFAVLLMGFLILYTVRVTQERNIAQRERDKAEQVVTLFTDLFKAADPREAGGDTLNVYQLIDQSQQRIETELAAQPEVQATMWTVLGGVYFNMGRYDQAAHFQEQALATRLTLYGDDHPDVAASMTLLSEALVEKADYDGADSLLRTALVRQRTLHGETHIDIIRTLNMLGLAMENKGAYDEAEGFLREAVAMRRRLEGTALPEVASLLKNLGEVLREQGDFAEAESVMREAIRRLRATVGNKHMDLAFALNDLALILSDQGTHDEAEALYREALTIDEQILGPEHPYVAQIKNNLGLMYWRKGDYAAAEPILMEALELDKHIRGKDHPEVALRLTNLAALYHTAGRYREAEAFLREALTIRRTRLGNDHPNVARTLSNLGVMLREQGQYDEAETLYAEALAIQQAELGDEDPNLSGSLYNLAAVLSDKEDYARAIPLYRQALALDRKALGEDHAFVGLDLIALANALRDAGTLDGADSLYTTALTLLRDNLPEGHEYISRALVGYGAWLTLQTRPDEAEPLLREALQIRQTVTEETERSIAEVHHWLGRCLTLRMRFAEAEPLLLTSYQVYRDALGPGNKLTRRTLQSLVTLYDVWGKPDKALEYKALLRTASG